MITIRSVVVDWWLSVLLLKGGVSELMHLFVALLQGLAAVTITVRLVVVELIGTILTASVCDVCILMNLFACRVRCFSYVYNFSILVFVCACFLLLVIVVLVCVALSVAGSVTIAVYCLFNGK